MLFKVNADIETNLIWTKINLKNEDKIHFIFLRFRKYTLLHINIYLYDVKKMLLGFIFKWLKKRER